VRLLVASGAHPVYARNLGTGEPTAPAVTMNAADQAVYHDDARPSSVTLPLHGRAFASRPSAAERGPAMPT
jgi:hypothetical protein